MSNIPEKIGAFRVSQSPSGGLIFTPPESAFIIVWLFRIVIALGFIAAVSFFWADIMSLPFLQKYGILAGIGLFTWFIIVIFLGSPLIVDVRIEKDRVICRKKLIREKTSTEQAITGGLKLRRAFSSTRGGKMVTLYTVAEKTEIELVSLAANGMFGTKKILDQQIDEIQQVIENVVGVKITLM